MWNKCTVAANVIAGYKSDVVRSNKYVNKLTSSENIESGNTQSDRWSQEGRKNDEKVTQHGHSIELLNSGISIFVVWAL